jgi:hypothetical protein
MARHVFKFVVSDVDLTAEQVDRVSQAIGQAGSSALAELTPDDALTLEGRPGLWWRGRPPVELRDPIMEFVLGQVGGED